MNTPSLHAAEERLLDAALEQVLCSARGKSKAAPSRWLVAALVMLGLGVTALTMWMSRADVAGKELQQPAPAPLPPPVSAEGRAELEALPADTQNLIAELMQPSDSEVFARFHQLRCLSILAARIVIYPTNTTEFHVAWSKPPLDMLDALSQLPMLESLQLPSQLALSPELLQPLAKCANLRELRLAGTQTLLGEDLIVALRRLQALRSLSLDGVIVDAAVMKRLRSLSLEELSLSRTNLDTASWRSLCQMHSLRRLALDDFGQQGFVWGAAHVAGAGLEGQLTLWTPRPEDLDHLAELPQLRGLVFRHCSLNDADLEHLPVGLTELTLSGTNVTPDGFGALGRFTRLQELEVRHPGPVLQLGAKALPPASRRYADDALAGALGAMRLTRMKFTGLLTPSLQKAIAAQPLLADLELVDDTPPSLEEIAKAPSLRRLRITCLAGSASLSHDDARPLLGCPALRELELSMLGDVDEIGLQQLLGARVHIVRVHP